MDFGKASDWHSRTIFCPSALPTSWFIIISIGGTERRSKLHWIYSNGCIKKLKLRYWHYYIEMRFLFKIFCRDAVCIVVEKLSFLCFQKKGRKHLRKFSCLESFNWNFTTFVKSSKLFGFSIKASLLWILSSEIWVNFLNF